jgi:hypothetical protein
MKKQNEKQQSQIKAQRQVNQRIKQDMEYLKKGKIPTARKNLISIAQPSWTSKIQALDNH